jgi:DNA replication protein DnaC
VSATYRDDLVLAICPTCDAGRAWARAWSGLPDEAQGVRLDGKVLRPVVAQLEAQQAIAHLVADPCGWLTLAGGYGTGKTTLIYAALNHLADQGVYGRYTTAPDLLDYLRDGMVDRGTSPGSRLRGLIEAPALAVDEIDKYHATQFAEEAIFKLFDAPYRARAEHATLIGYNLDGADRVPPFLVSRIRDGRFQYVELRGADLRPTLKRHDPWERGADDGP